MFLVSFQKQKWQHFFFLIQNKTVCVFNLVTLFKKTTLNLTNLINDTTFLQKELYFLQLLTLKKASIVNYPYLCDITAIHYPQFWFFLKIKYIFRSFITMKTLIINYDLALPINMPTLSHIYKASNWLEREVYDMFGIWFFNHLNLRKLLNDYGFKGFPLLKDFPVFGYKELRYDFERQQLIYTPIILTQKWRNYTFLRQYN